ncbi:MAG: ABC transporter ATP-binding protein [Actinomycetota bacterium]|nr:ABC transporter ATP-binding protein [Actinomycetota bacterium]
MPVTAHLAELRGVRAGYGGVEVLHGVDLVVPHRSVVALLGPNGAGKTTALRCLSGEVVPTAGCVHVAGTHVNGSRPEHLARAGVCTIPEGRGVFPALTVRENLQMATHGRTRSLDEIETRAYARFPRLGERRHQRAGSLSGGEQQMLALARGLSVDPSVLLLDELSMGLAPKVVRELYEQVAQLADEGVSVLVVEQFATAVLAVANYVAVLVRGSIVLLGEPADVADGLSAAYLGEKMSVLTQL